MNELDTLVKPRGSRPRTKIRAYRVSSRRSPLRQAAERKRVKVKMWFEHKQPRIHFLGNLLALSILAMAATGCGATRQTVATNSGGKDGVAAPAVKCDRAAAESLLANDVVTSLLQENELGAADSIPEFLCADLDGDGNRDVVFTVYDGSNDPARAFFAFRASPSGWVDITPTDQEFGLNTGIRNRKGSADLWTNYATFSGNESQSCPKGPVVWTRWKYSPKLGRLDKTISRRSYRTDENGCSTAKFIPRDNASDDRVIRWNRSGIPSRIGPLNQLDDGLSAINANRFIEKFGSPDKIDRSGQACALEWKALNVKVYLMYAGGPGDQCDRGTLSTAIFGKGWRTSDQGLKVGVSLERLQKLYPSSSLGQTPRGISGFKKVWTLSKPIEYQGGSLVLINAGVKNGRVKAIVVDSPAGGD